MSALRNIPKKVLEGEVVVNGCSVMAFLADYREDGGKYVAEDIIAAAGASHDPRRNPATFINSNMAYLEELASSTKCKVSDLIGLGPDDRYWCTHQIAVRLAAWVSPKLAVAFDRALIQFAKQSMARACEWIDKRGEAKEVVRHFNNMIDHDIETPPGKEDGMKYGVLHNAIQKPFNKAIGGPSDTKAFKDLNGVSAAMDAYETPFIVGVTLARSVTIANVKDMGIHDLWDAKKEAEDNAQQIAEKIKQLRNKGRRAS